jgi:hypothetical protein
MIWLAVATQLGWDYDEQTMTENEQDKPYLHSNRDASVVHVEGRKDKRAQRGTLHKVNEPQTPACPSGAGQNRSTDPEQ